MENIAGSLNEAVDADINEAWKTVDGLIDGFLASLPKLAIAVALFLLIWGAAPLVRAAIFRFAENRRNRSLGIALGRLAHVGIVFIGLIVAVAVVAPTIGAKELLQLFGIGSVAAGFAFRDILQNFLAGLLILIRQTFREGNVIEFGDYYGTVREISTRSTWITTFDGRDVAVPNGEIFKSPIVVVTAGPYLRSQYDFGVSYDVDVDRAIDTILSAVRSVSLVRNAPAPDAGVIDLGSSAVKIRARWWVPNDDNYLATTMVLRAVKKALDSAGIEMPYPHTVVISGDDPPDPGDKDTGEQRAKEAA